MISSLKLANGTVNDSNFYIKNNLAYTEDHVLIFNVFLYKISKKIKEADVRNHFQQYGTVTKTRLVEIKTTGHRKGSRVGFVYFKEADSAAKVLLKRHHVMKDSKVISVKACDSWHQPDGNKTSHPKGIHIKYDSDDQRDNKSSCMLIHDLNDDCLLSILAYLPLRDQVSFACSHNYFTSIFQTYAKSNYKTFDSGLLEDLSLWNIRQFFINVGQFIEILTGIFYHKERNRIVNFIKSYCPNLKKITVDIGDIKVGSLHKLLSNKAKLKTLHLTKAFLTDNCMYAIKKLDNLENLVITQAYGLAGQHLHMLKKLKKLRLFCCCNLQPFHLQKALTCMPNLKILDIRGAERLNADFFAKLPKLCKNLEHLQLSATKAPMENIARIPKLKSLSFVSNIPFETRTFTDILSGLVKFKSEQFESLQFISQSLINTEQCELISKLKKLKTLYLPYSLGITNESLTILSQLKELEELNLYRCLKITNPGVLDIIRNCQKLNWINLECTNISNDFVTQVLKMFKAEPRANGPITILLANSAIHEDVLTKNVNIEKLKCMVNLKFKSEEHPKSFANLGEDVEDYWLLDEYLEYDDDIEDDDFGYGFDSDIDDDEFDDDDEDFGLWLHGDLNQYW